MRTGLFRIPRRTRKRRAAAGAAAGLLAVCISALAAFPAFAGAWTKRSPEGQVTGKTYYVGDNGSYVRSAWVFVNDVWYWLQGDGSLPNAYGISTDGYIFNEKGVYVPSVTGDAYHYRDTTMIPSGQNPAGGGALNPSGGGAANPTTGSTAPASGFTSGGGWTGYGTATVQGTGYNPPSGSESGYGPGFSSTGRRPKNSDYGPGAGYVSDPR